MEKIKKQLRELKVIPVITIENKDSALGLADALIKGKLPLAEITFRTPAAAAAISIIKKERPEVLIGAGTILTLDDLKKAGDSGAEFGVAPGFNHKIVELALKMGFPFFPGVMTPSNVESGLEYGLTLLKFYPAEAAGGVKMVKSLIGPYSHTGINFIPTGGIGFNSIQSYLDIPQVVAVGGSWIATQEDIRNADWKKITANCLSVSERY